MEGLTPDQRRENAKQLLAELKSLYDQLTYDERDEARYCLMVNIAREG
jgi:hypothetical protein